MEIQLSDDDDDLHELTPGFDDMFPLHEDHYTSRKQSPLSMHLPVISYITIAFQITQSISLNLFV